MLISICYLKIAIFVEWSDYKQNCKQIEAYTNKNERERHSFSIFFVFSFNEWIELIFHKKTKLLFLFVCYRFIFQVQFTYTILNLIISFCVRFYVYPYWICSAFFSFFSIWRTNANSKSACMPIFFFLLKWNRWEGAMEILITIQMRGKKKVFTIPNTKK